MFDSSSTLLLPSHLRQMLLQEGPEEVSRGLLRAMTHKTSETHSEGVNQSCAHLNSLCGQNNPSYEFYLSTQPIGFPRWDGQSKEEGSPHQSQGSTKGPILGRKQQWSPHYRNWRPDIIIALQFYFLRGRHYYTHAINAQLTFCSLFFKILNKILAKIFNKILAKILNKILAIKSSSTLKRLMLAT